MRSGCYASPATVYNSAGDQVGDEMVREMTIEIADGVGDV